MVPSGWTLTNLGKLCDINPKKIKKPENGKVSFIAMNQLSEEGQLITHLPRDYEEVSKGFTSFKDGDVLVAKITPCFENGKGALVQGLTNGVGFGSTEFHVLRPKENTSPEFIYYLTRTKELRVRGENNMQGSAGHRRVTADYFNAYKVLTPPLPEQRKIAQILSTWDKAIGTTERLVNNSKQQKKALMQQLLTGKKRLLDDSGKPFKGEWETAILSDIGKVSIGLVTTMTKYYVDDGIPLIRNSDIKPNTINKTKMLQLCSDFSSDYDNRKLRKGDIVTVHTGEVGVSSVIDDELDGCIGFATLNTRPNISKVNSQYLSWYFNSERFINWCVSMSTGDGRQNLNLKDFVKAKVLLPSLEEQHKIVSVLKNADQEIELLEHQLADLKQEKKALMQQLLTGKRRVKVDDEAVA